MKKILITTAIDYTNDVVHIGHAYQKIVADCLARYYKKNLGEKNVFFVTGTDEHGGNIEVSARARGKDPKAFVDEIVNEDKKQWEALGVEPDRFIRTTDEDHKNTVKTFWEKSVRNGDIYKGIFHGLYCLGCESYKTESEIVDRKCPLHRTKILQKVSEENYFFKWSKYQDFLEKLFKGHNGFVYPESRQNEMREFLKEGIEDIVISRSRNKVGWGIAVPGDTAQVIYVWFDALINYYTAASPKGFWDGDTHVVHILGKDNCRWHSLLWPAMLQSAGFRVPDRIYAHGFINLNGQKISKSLGNVIRPTELVDQFGSDAVRYFFLKYGPSIDDVDISIERIKDVYNSELANGLGNLVARVAKLAEGHIWNFPLIKRDELHTLHFKIRLWMGNFQLNRALDAIMSEVKKLDDYLDREKPWEKKGKEQKNILLPLITGSEEIHSVREIAEVLEPFMPETSQKIIAQFSQEKILSHLPYFPRK
ncbi:MAG TPA: methionine--tRNA ligase [Patescibacteria group bacterium]|nr:methionine--tRNA ligase [Patescibacteria group bacterium]